MKSDSKIGEVGIDPPFLVCHGDEVLLVTDIDANRDIYFGVIVHSVTRLGEYAEDWKVGAWSRFKGQITIID